MNTFIFVDDEDYLLKIIPPLIEWEKYGFELAGVFDSGEKALNFLSSYSADVVITDIKMGGISGIELCKKLRESGSDITIVLISGYKDFEDARLAIKYNVFDYISKPISFTALDTLFKRLRDNFDSCYTDRPQEINNSGILDRAKKYIWDNLGRDVTLEDTAKFVSLSASYFSRFFKMRTGESFSEYLIDVRIEKAKQLLDKKRLRVYDVCGQVGYKNLQYFYRVFKQRTGFTPTEYRNNAK